MKTRNGSFGSFRGRFIFEAKYVALLLLYALEALQAFLDFFFIKLLIVFGILLDSCLSTSQPHIPNVEANLHHVDTLARKILPSGVDGG